MRVEYVDHMESLGLNIRKNGMHLLWILDMPLFELDGEKKLHSAHHPFTAPNPTDLDLLETNPIEVRIVRQNRN